MGQRGVHTLGDVSVVVLRWRLRLVFWTFGDEPLDVALDDSHRDGRRAKPPRERELPHHLGHLPRTPGGAVVFN